MRKNVIKILFMVFVIGWMGMIFYFSHQTGVQSSSMSSKITNKILHLFISSYDDLPLNEQTEIFKNASFVIRKLAHYFEYAILGLLLFLAIYNFTNKRGIVFSLSIGIGVLYAISDEVHQSFIGGRAPMVLEIGRASCRERV